MLSCQRVYNCMRKNGIDFFVGVPDSYLNGFCNYILENTEENKTVIAANEGNAIAIAAGHYIASGNISLVYMQNSGLGNTINPLASLTDEYVYGIPMLLLIGWRGKPQTGDWAQHTRQGQITPALLDNMDIQYDILVDNDDEAEKQIYSALDYIKKEKKTYALIVPNKVLSGSKTNDRIGEFAMSRREAMESILDVFPKETFYVATTGRATRELFFLREDRNESKHHDFLNVGAMGHTSSIAFGIALTKPNKNVVVLDGDGAAIMHLGSITTPVKYVLNNYYHIILNNCAHESVGGQPTAGKVIDFTSIAKACGYATVGKAVVKKEELQKAIKELKEKTGPKFLEIKINKGMSKMLPPLDFDIKESLIEIMKEINC